MPFIGPHGIAGTELGKGAKSDAAIAKALASGKEKKGTMGMGVKIGIAVAVLAVVGFAIYKMRGKAKGK